MSAEPYIRVNVNGRHTREHRLRAEQIVGHPLDPKHQIHHYTEDRKNGPFVICEDDAYHKLLHVRARALKATGDPHKRKCCICKEWDDPDNLAFVKTQHRYYHNKCTAAKQLAYKKAKRLLQAA